MKLTTKNYFSAKNTFLSSHKIKDYLLSPQYYKAKHTDKIIVEEPTDAMHIGHMVEDILDNKFAKNWNVVVRRSKENEDKRTQVTESMYLEALDMATKIKNTDVFKTINKFKKQVILQNGKLCGMLDYLDINDNGVATIVDLKTTRSVDERKYWYICDDMGYFIQAACYSKLVKECFPHIKEVKFYHLAVEKDPKDIHKVKLFLFPDWKIKETEAYVNVLIEEILNRTNWEEDEVSFNTAVSLTNPQSRRQEMEELGDLII